MEQTNYRILVYLSVDFSCVTWYWIGDSLALSSSFDAVNFFPALSPPDSSVELFDEEAISHMDIWRRFLSH